MQKITRMFQRHDLAVKAAHDVEACGVPVANITLLAVKVTGSQHSGSSDAEAAESGTGAIVAGPEARVAGTSDETADANAEHGDATLLTVQVEDNAAEGVRRILEQGLR